jgi:hypothetical protein
MLVARILLRFSRQRAPPFDDVIVPLLFADDALADLVIAGLEPSALRTQFLIK